VPANHEVNRDRHEHDIFVVSDLHIGDGSAKDSLLKRDNQTLLYRFLDKVDHCRGRLIILGDLFGVMALFTSDRGKSMEWFAGSICGHGCDLCAREPRLAILERTPVLAAAASFFCPDEKAVCDENW